MALYFTYVTSKCQSIVIITRYFTSNNRGVHPMLTKPTIYQSQIVIKQCIGINVSVKVIWIFSIITLWTNCYLFTVNYQQAVTPRSIHKFGGIILLQSTLIPNIILHFGSGTRKLRHSYKQTVYSILSPKMNALISTRFCHCFGKKWIHISIILIQSQ